MVRKPINWIKILQLSNIQDWWIRLIGWGNRKCNIRELHHGWEWNGRDVILQMPLNTWTCWSERYRYYRSIKRKPSRWCLRNLFRCGRSYRPKDKRLENVEYKIPQLPLFDAYLVNLLQVCRSTLIFKHSSGIFHRRCLIRQCQLSLSCHERAKKIDNIRLRWNI